MKDGQLILKSIWKSKGPAIAKTLLKKNNAERRPHMKIILLKNFDSVCTRYHTTYASFPILSASLSLVQAHTLATSPVLGVANFFMKAQHNNNHFMPELHTIMGYHGTHHV